MGKPTGFLEYTRVDPTERSVKERIKNYKEFHELLPENVLTEQAARCMDCGIPFCHSFGCPVINRIPDFNDLIYRGKWKKALAVLHSTNNFPEVTGRVCPAPCEAACTLSINQPAITIKEIELQIVERGWREGWIKPVRPAVRTHKKVAVVGSGPAGLAAAQQLTRAGHTVVLLEKDDRLGGLLRYGIPDYKLDKKIISRRIEQMVSEGIIFEPNTNVGIDITARDMARSYDAILITTGAGVPRDLNVPGRDAKGIHFAMEFLGQNNRRVAGDKIAPKKTITARNKNVVVIGGGDTGSDCIGTSIRQGAKNVTQIELLPVPPEKRDPCNPWPEWPTILRTSTSQEEGCERLWSIMTQAFNEKDGKVTGLQCVKLKWTEPDENGRRSFEEIPDSAFTLPADLVLLAMGFVHVEHGPFVTDAKLELNDRGNIVTAENYMTSVPGVFAAGDAATGASLVVRAIHHGRAAAACVDAYLSSTSLRLDIR